MSSSLEQWKDFELRADLLSRLSIKVQCLFVAECVNDVLHFFRTTRSKDRSLFGDKRIKAIEKAISFVRDHAIKGHALGSYRSSHSVMKSIYQESLSPRCPVIQKAVAGAAAFAAHSIALDQVPLHVTYSVSNAVMHMAYAISPLSRRMIDYGPITPDYSRTYDFYLKSYRDIKFNPEWITEHTIGIAAKIWEDRNVGNLPILADALQDAGAEEHLVQYMREGSNTLADWFLWNLNLHHNT
jgi:hypothetical protein